MGKVKMSGYFSKDFWQDKYSRSQCPNDFLFNYEKIKPFIEEYLPSDTSDPILDAGCGISTVCEELVQEGYTEVKGVDFSESAIEMMKKRVTEDKSDKLFYEVRDLVNDDVREGQKYSLILDIFTADTVFTNEDYISSVKKLFESYAGMLREGGKVLLFTGGEEEMRTTDLAIANK